MAAKSSAQWPWTQSMSSQLIFSELVPLLVHTNGHYRYAFLEMNWIVQRMQKLNENNLYRLTLIEQCLHIVHQAKQFPFIIHQHRVNENGIQKSNSSKQSVRRFANVKKMDQEKCEHCDTRHEIGHWEKAHSENFEASIRIEVDPIQWQNAKNAKHNLWIL